MPEQKMIEPKGWTLIESEEHPIFGECRFYTRGKLHLAMSKLPDQDGYRISVSRNGQHPKKQKHLKLVQDSFPPGEWFNTACSGSAHHWSYEHNASTMTKEEIDALAAEHGID